MAGKITRYSRRVSGLLSSPHLLGFGFKSSAICCITDQRLQLQRYAHNGVYSPSQEDIYDPKYNPQGIVNLGTGTNYLMQNEVKAKTDSLRLQQLCLEPIDPEDTERELSQAIASFMTKFFRASSAVQPSELKVMNNVTRCIDLLGTFLGKPQDVFLCPAPAYSRLFYGCTQYSALEVVPVPLQHDLEQRKYFCLSVSTLEKAIKEQIEQGKCVRGILITNPNNPSGEVYSASLLLDIMELCLRYDIDVIVSEVYSLSIFGDRSQFTSVLELGSKILNPDKTHVLWGLTKDLCLTGFHAAVLHSKNTALMSKVQGSNLFGSILMTDQQLLTMYINDHDWVENNFLVKNHERMKRAFLRAKSKIETLGIEVFMSQAGFFLFCNFSKILYPNTEEKSIEMFKLLIKNRVYIVPYWEMKCGEPGWFRIVFTAEDHIFDVGFDRIKKTVTEWNQQTSAMM